MYYKNLHELIFSSSSSMRYFTSLPVEIQLLLHEHESSIHTLSDLHIKADIISGYRKAVLLSEKKPY